MIDVDPRVKDALRKGCYKKNYRIIVRGIVGVVSYSDIATFTSESLSYTVGDDGDVLMWYAEDSEGIAVGQYTVTHSDQTSVSGEIVGEASIALAANDVVTVANMTVDSILLRKQNIAYEEQVIGTIDNDKLVKESVNIDERMCTGDELKFGLCEGASIEFQYFDFPNIRGCNVQVFIDVQYKTGSGTLAWQEIPMGIFDIDECSTQLSTGIIKATGYNKLRSDYLDEKCNEAIIEAATAGERGRTDGISIGSILSGLLSGFSVEPDYREMQVVNVRNSTGVTWHTILLYKIEGGRYVPFSGSGQWSDKTWLWMTRTNCIYTCGQRGAVTARIALKENELYNMVRSHIVDMLENQGISDTYVATGRGYTPTLDYLLNVNMPSWANLANEVILGIGDQHDSRTVWLKIGGEPESELTRSEYLYDEGYTSGHSLHVHFIGNVEVEFDPPEDSPAFQLIYVRVNQASEAYARTVMQAIEDDGLVHVEERIDTPMETIAFTKESAEELPDVTLRELQSAVYETEAEFGQLDRVTDLFGGVNLSRGRLFPADDLYPDNALYPMGTSEGSYRSQYSKLWTDEVGVQTFRYLIITYKGLTVDERGNTHEEEMTLQRTVNADGTTDYYMSDNWLFKNLVWTAEQVGSYADAMVTKMRDIKWFPFEMWAAGLPYLEVGDEIEINTRNGTYTSYVLTRQLNGIQNLEDTYTNGTLDIF